MTKCVPFYHVVAMADPQVVIFVYSLKNICLLGVSEDYTELLEFNINTVKNKLMAAEKDSLSGKSMTTTTARNEKQQSKKHVSEEDETEETKDESGDKIEKAGACSEVPTKSTETKQTKKKKQKKSVVGGIKLF